MDSVEVKVNKDRDAIIKCVEARRKFAERQAKFIKRLLSQALRSSNKPSFKRRKLRRTYRKRRTFRTRRSYRSKW